MFTKFETGPIFCEEKQPLVLYVNEFNSHDLRQFHAELNQAMLTGQDIIPVIIDSYGGSIYTLFGMIDLLEQCGKIVATIGTGRAMSAGAVLLACGGTEGYRYMGPNGTVMIHQAAGGAIGKVEEMKTSFYEAQRLNDKMIEKLSAKSKNKNPLYFKNMLKEAGNMDLFFDAETAKKHGIIDHIKIPTLKISTRAHFEMI